jgi:(2Fe-2S) ferredoxin
VSRERNLERAAGRRGGARPAEGGCTVTVCRGCCCGRPEKNPGVDHAGQLDQLREGLPPGAKLRVSECLDVCERSNVVVVGPSPAGRAAGARPVWFGLVADPDAITDITAWVAAGGPGLADPPPALDLYEFKPSRRVREESALDGAT